MAITERDRVTDGSVTKNGYRPIKHCVPRVSPTTSQGLQKQSLQARLVQSAAGRIRVGDEAKDAHVGLCLLQRDDDGDRLGQRRLPDYIWEADVWC